MSNDDAAAASKRRMLPPPTARHRCRRGVARVRLDDALVTEGTRGQRLARELVARRGANLAHRKHMVAAVVHVAHQQLELEVEQAACVRARVKGRSASSFEAIPGRTMEAPIEPGVKGCAAARRTHRAGAVFHGLHAEALHQLHAVHVAQALQLQRAPQERARAVPPRQQPPQTPNAQLARRAPTMRRMLPRRALFTSWPRVLPRSGTRRACCAPRICMTPRREAFTLSSVCVPWYSATAKRRCGSQNGASVSTTTGRRTDTQRRASSSARGDTRWRLVHTQDLLLSQPRRRVLTLGLSVTGAAYVTMFMLARAPEPPAVARL